MCLIEFSVKETLDSSYINIFAVSAIEQLLFHSHFELFEKAVSLCKCLRKVFTAKL